MNFGDEAQKAALLEEIKTYEESGGEELFARILERFHAPHRSALEERLAANQRLLETYPLYRAGDEPLPEVLPLWRDDREAIYALPQERAFRRLDRLHLNKGELRKGVAIMVGTQLWAEDLEEYERLTAQDPAELILDQNVPLYLTYNAPEWSAFLQLEDLGKLTASGRMVFLVGAEEIKKYFWEDGTIFPEGGFELKQYGGHFGLIQEVYQEKLRRLNENIQEIQRYYSENRAEVGQHFVEGRPRILFLTTRFSTAVQYHIRDCMDAAQRLGCETALVIEKDGLHKLDNVFEGRFVVEFKPDALFMTDHFRFERGTAEYPEGMFFISWVQDPLKDVLDRATPSKLGDRDIVITHYTTWKPFWDTGYDRKRTLDAPVPANSYVYRPYELSDEERELYQADICFVCHAADVEGSIRMVTDQLSPQLRPMIRSLYKEYHRLAYNGVIYYDEEKFRDFIEKYLVKKYGYTNTGMRNSLAKHMLLYYNQVVFRQVLVDWLIEAGFRNIKLWGGGWLDYPKYKDYAMGPAQNGETLSKIYQASKIVLGNNIATTAAARAWESMLSGAFYMSNYIPPEADGVDIRKILKVGKGKAIKPGDELVMFHDKRDLITKVKYYLSHDEQRREMARRGREAALERMTYDALMKRVIQFIGDKVLAGEAD